MFDYLTGMSLFLPGDTVSDFIDTFKTHYDCGENYPNYSQFVYGYATLLAGGDYNFTLQKPEQSVWRTRNRSVLLDAEYRVRARR